MIEATLWWAWASVLYKLSRRMKADGEVWHARIFLMVAMIAALAPAAKAFLNRARVG